MSRKHKGAAGHGGGSEERWLLTYADLITLLLAFFIILYAGSKADLAKFSQLSKGLSQAFGVVSMFPEGGGESGLLNQASGIMDFGQLTASQRAFMQISENMQSFASDHGMGEQIAVNIKTEGIAITLSNALLFPSGGVELSAESQSALTQIAELIRPLPNEVRVEAHTDNLPTDSAVYATNWELSTARAAVVTRYLSQNAGIDPKRLAALGFAEFRPLFTNDTVTHRQANRRADILILYPNDNPAPMVNVLGQDLKQSPAGKSREGQEVK